MIRRFLAWLFGRIPEPGPLFPMDDRTLEPSNGASGGSSLAAQREQQDRMLREIDAKLDEARAHIEYSERRKRPKLP
jgi:hypothetical protein